jgi:GxxExxY protein
LNWPNRELLSSGKKKCLFIYYKSNQVGTRRVDFLVEDKITIELKAIIQLEDVQLAQAINYLEAYNIPIGLLINFGSAKLQFKRVMKPIRNLS